MSDKQFYDGGYYSPSYIYSRENEINLGSALSIAADTARNIYGEVQARNNRLAVQKANQQNIDIMRSNNALAIANASADRSANSLSSRMSEYRALGLNPLSAQEASNSYAPSLQGANVSPAQQQQYERSMQHTRDYLETLRLADSLATSDIQRKKISQDMDIALSDLSRRNAEFSHKQRVDNFNLMLAREEQDRKNTDSEFSHMDADRRYFLAEKASALQERIQAFNELEKNRRFNLDSLRIPWQQIVLDAVLHPENYETIFDKIKQNISPVKLGQEYSDSLKEHLKDFFNKNFTEPFGEEMQYQKQFWRRIRKKLRQNRKL